MFLSAVCGIALVASAAWAAPVATTLSPVNGAKGVHPLALVSITFDGAVEAGQAKLLELRRKSDSHVLSAIAAASSFVSIEGATASIAFPSRQVMSGAVYVTVEAGAFVSKADQSAFAGVAGQTWSFELQGETAFPLAQPRPAPLRPTFRLALAPRAFRWHAPSHTWQPRGGDGMVDEAVSKRTCSEFSWSCAPSLPCAFRLSQRGLDARRWCGARMSPRRRAASTP